ncbi:conserved Plasmodium protein, unknown function [Plasmodium chabaudi adami]|uniref:Telomere length and silencing protein 1 n=1 Tax=Plasmodium chabaudi adami TaxID=5826 RepID=A0A1D3LG35_PLACE|nr:conserved Plasmodium protein, unknown function [Plasmodium chabaudi adami]
MIKNRKIKNSNNNYKRRTPIEQDEALKEAENCNKDKNGDEDNKLLKLKTSKSLKEFQNMRLKKKGINADNLIGEKKELEKSEKSDKLLEKNFTKNLTEKEIEEAHIQLFIQNNMKEFYEQIDNKEENDEEKFDEEKKENYNDIIKNLYKLPDDLKVKTSTNNTQERLNCFTGINEVPLPLEMKLKNIEETEKIKRQLLKKAKFMNTKTK